MPTDIDWATMGPAELAFRLTLVVLGVAVAVLIAWLWVRAKPGDNLGCLPIILGAIALVLLLGGIGGPDFVNAFWN